jgi:hypothetical protein
VTIHPPWHKELVPQTGCNATRIDDKALGAELPDHHVDVVTLLYVPPFVGMTFD